MAESIFSALLKAQTQFGAIVKKSSNPAFKSRYANLEAVLEAITPALNSCGLFLTQETSRSENMIEVKTIVFNSVGEKFEGGTTCLAIVKNDAQGVGSAITYARRYSLKTFFALSEDDDDGNAASRNEKYIQNKKPKDEISKETMEKWKEGISSGKMTSTQIIQKLEKVFELTEQQVVEILQIEQDLQNQ